MAWLPKRLALVSALLVFCSCAVDPGQDVSSWTQWTQRYGFSSAAPEIFVVALDDSDSRTADQLRNDLRPALQAAFNIAFESAGDGVCTWHGLDWCAVVVLPSGPDDARFVGPETDPELCVRFSDAPDVVSDALAERIVATTQAHLAPPGRAYRLLESTVDALDVLLHRRAPKTLQEAALGELTERSDATTIRVLLATSRDDASPGAASDYILPASDLPLVDWMAVGPVLPNVSCRGDVPFATRLDAALTPYDGRIDWPCDSAWASPASVRLWYPYVDYGASCLPRRVLRDGEGNPRCLAEVSLLDPDARCEPLRGWSTPGDPWGTTPLVRQGSYGEERVCWLRALTGEARVACETDPSPTLCESGYCVVETPELTQGCFSEEHGTVRFLGGAAPPWGYVTMTCDLE